MSKNVIIDFAALEGPVFTGRPRGEALRQKLKVEEFDATDTHVEVKIPDSTYSISSSFILGLFGKSVVRAGSKQAFYKKYHFTSNSLFQGIVDSCVTRALQEKNILAR
jgi:GTP-dependent phosphoenolpyruvate carboxykinase